MNLKPKIEILDRYLKGTATLEEEKNIEEWLKEMVLEPDEWAQLTDEEKNVQLKDLYQLIEDKIEPKGRVIQMKNGGWLSVAAVILLLLVSGTWLFYSGDNSKPVEVETTAVQDTISPGGTKALLTLGDGRQIVLDSFPAGTLTTQGGIKVIQTGAVLSYEGKAAGTDQWNTVNTPKGGQYVVLLNDGSRVWLNAASSVTFPVAFEGPERRVKVNGEVFFEVKHSNHPFIVEKDGLEIQVMGTEFNVNAYDDHIAVTLVQGAVKVSENGEHLLLKPGEQALITPESPFMELRKDVDVTALVAWKNGYFSFRNTSLENILKQLSRWYDVEVVYEGEIPDVTFSGEIGMKLNLDEVLDILNETRIRYKIAGRKLIILPVK